MEEGVGVINGEGTKTKIAGGEVGAGGQGEELLEVIKQGTDFIVSIKAKLSRARLAACWNINRRRLRLCARECAMLGDGIMLCWIISS